MGIPVFIFALLFLLLGSLATRSYLLNLLGFPLYVVAGLIVFSLVTYLRELILSSHRPPVAGSMINQLVHFRRIFDYQIKLALRYHTYRLITNSHSHVYTADPSNVEYILKTNFPNYGKGEYNRGVMKDLFGEGIFAVDGKKWRHQRKLASYEFSAKILRDFSCSVFQSNAAKLASKVYVEALASKEMDLQDMLMKSAMDTMFKVGFGVDLNTLSKSDEIMKRFLNIGLERNLKENIKVIDSFVYKLIHHKREQTRNEQGAKEDILSRFPIESEKDAANMTDVYLRDIILNFIFAGKDTTANTLAWFFYMLCKHPLIQEKVVQDVKLATELRDDLSIDEFVLGLTEAALDRMQYLHAALTETLRLYPAVPVDGKCADEDDILPDGHRIKKGDGISYMPVFQGESPFKFTAFQGGPRICLGKEFAYRQMKIIAATLVMFMRFKLVEESMNATYITMFTLHMDKGLPLFAFPRFNS
ncbi:cytochrome P450 [Salvia divinorum]|uniref:Cytochrome P450 n=1 Tax=Salvia divinorum TaxID=28513 RepID=A0ABD1IB26_SALDI